MYCPAFTNTLFTQVFEKFFDCIFLEVPSDANSLIFSTCLEERVFGF